MTCVTSLALKISRPYNGSVEPLSVGHRRRLGLTLCAGLLLTSAPAPAQNAAPVTITGGRDANGQNYAWTVTNHGETAIVGIEFPHYRADMFSAPPGWQVDATNLQNVGVSQTRGVCKASTDDPRLSIQRNRSAEFTMRIARGGPHPGAGVVTVELADGKRLQIAGVDLPTAPASTEKWLMPVGIGVLLALLIAWQQLRRKAPAQPADSPPDAARP